MTCKRTTEYAILRVANVVMVITDTRNAPKVSAWGRFYSLSLQVGLIPRLVAVVLSLIEPFADAIGNHTSHDGEKKCCESHRHTPLLLPYLGGRQRIKYSIFRHKEETHGQTQRREDIYTGISLMTPLQKTKEVYVEIADRALRHSR